MEYRELLKKLAYIKENSKNFYKSRDNFKTCNENLDVRSVYSQLEDLLDGQDVDSLKKLKRDFQALLKNKQAVFSNVQPVTLGLMGMCVSFSVLVVNSTDGCLRTLAFCLTIIALFLVFFKIVCIFLNDRYEQWFQEDVLEVIEDVLKEKGKLSVENGEPKKNEKIKVNG